MRQALTFSTLSLAFLFAVSGCERPEDPMLKILESTASQTRVDDLSRTMDFVFSERQFDQTEFNNSISQGLNRWAGYSAAQFEKTDWKEDATINEVLEPYGTRIPTVNRIEGSSFISSDGQYLQSMAWLGQIAERVEENPYLGQFELFRLMADNYEPTDEDESPVDTVFQKLNPDMEKADAEKLALAVQLFDWVTRNIQLDETPSYTEDEIEEKRLVEADTLSASGLAAPGAKRTAWQLLMFARGDYIEKAKLFMMLCHQADLPAVMFATGDDETPWAVGVLIGEEYYLFDSKMGLPIPGKNNQNIATLSDVTADPSLLSSLDLSVKESLAENTKYWVTAEDLESITGLVYWNPLGVSQRIAVLEENLVADQRLLLVQRADETMAQLPKIENVEYKPWDISLQTAEFRQVLREALPKAVTDDALAERIRWYFSEEAYVMQFPNYRTGRTRFLLGKFERPRESRTRDAIESFAMLMYEDEIIDGLKSDRSLQTMIGIRSAGQTEGEFEREIRSRQAQMRLVRRDAGLFMCQAHFDNGSMSTTANWVPKLLEEQDVERWEPGLKYLNARSLEARHQYDEAIEQLKAEGPQQHGNLIRARLLKQQIETQYASKADKSNEQ
ncbi:hypothetical protein [Mariniblastus fucicola]|uniref:Transglutaminase-like superfamily protein n=1 Tax=Mariniblastus fucicola TaxID=980251 RepID=A0A5B9PA36_9BACT|nr:hypothetical protein [Mariniblastus fucicola]QEG23228.1 hypothetical protein MFFC18_31240 [Mariniblastus fucicola]